MRALSEEVRCEPGSGEPVRRRRGERLRLRVAQHSCRRPVNPFAAVGGGPPVLPPAPDGKPGPSTKKAKIMEGPPRGKAPQAGKKAGRPAGGTRRRLATFKKGPKMTVPQGQNPGVPSKSAENASRAIGFPFSPCRGTPRRALYRRRDISGKSWRALLREPPTFPYSLWSWLRSSSRDARRERSRRRRRG